MSNVVNDSSVKPKAQIDTHPELQSFGVYALVSLEMKEKPSHNHTCAVAGGFVAEKQPSHSGKGSYFLSKFIYVGVHPPVTYTYSKLSTI